MQDKFNQFYSLYNGQQVEAEDPDNKYQCFDLAFKWADFLGIPRDTIRHLYAYQIFTNPAPNTSQYWDIIPNNATFIPQVGDLGVFDTTVGKAGHVEIQTDKADVNTFTSFDQNWAGKKYATLTAHTYTGFLGVLRPKVSSSNQDALTACLAQHTQLVTEANQKDETIRNLNGTINGKNSEIATYIANSTKQQEQITALTAENTKLKEDTVQLPLLQVAVKEADEKIRLRDLSISSLTTENKKLQETAISTAKAQTLLSELLKAILEKRW